MTISLLLPWTPSPPPDNCPIRRGRFSGHSSYESVPTTYATRYGHEYTEHFSDRKRRLHTTLAEESRRDQLAYELRLLAKLKEELAECVDPAEMNQLKRRISRQFQNVNRWKVSK